MKTINRLKAQLRGETYDRLSVSCRYNDSGNNLVESGGLDKNSDLLADFTTYCQDHPDERFWQALRNWSGYKFILGTNNGSWSGPGVKDTFYKEEK